MGSLRAAAASANMTADDSMVIAGSIFPGSAKGEEAPLRASALIVEADVRICLVSCDVIVLERDLLDRVARQIESESSVPFDNVLIAATHTHHAPTTVTVHGYSRDDGFCTNVEDAIMSAARAAARKLDDPAAPHETEVELCFALGQEATVGQNSRLLMKDGSIAWSGHDPAEAVRPTGPMDPVLPVLAFRKPGGALAGLAFSHSCHNIGRRSSAGQSRSPGFYGLAAQELEAALGAPVLFLPGAFGSTHNLGVTPEEAVLRVTAAVEDALTNASAGLKGPVASSTREVEYRVREFDEAEEDRAVSYWCNRWFDDPQPTIEVFRNMRRSLAPRQGELRKTWLQVVRVGDVALVGIPGELFTTLGLAIKRRSPFRHTYVCGLANDWIGYIPDQEAFGLGGYQVWTGLHSLVASGAGEAMVEEAVQMLDDLARCGMAASPQMRTLQRDDAAAL